MGTRAQVLELARSQVGTVGGEKYWREAFGWSGNGYPFCAVGLSWLFKKTDTDCPYFPSTVAFDRRDLGRIGDRWVDPYSLQSGDPLTFDWDGDGGGDHVGIVDTVLGYGYYKTVEFNVSNKVDYRYRRVSDGIIGGIRPRYASNAGWIFDKSNPDKQWYRHDDGGYTKDGWELIGGKWYRFDSSGWLQYGWVKDKGKWYWLHDKHDGHFGECASGWVQVKGKWYYASKTTGDPWGSLYVGLRKIDGKLYCFAPDPDCRMLTGLIIHDGKAYLAGDDGAIKTGCKVELTAGDDGALAL